MTASPRKVFVATPVSADDMEKPFVLSMVCTQDEKLVMSDCDNMKVKTMNMSDPHTVSTSLRVEEKPLHLALLSDGQIALTTYRTTMYLLMVTPALAVRSRIQTDRRYVGVADGLTDHTLLVSCEKTDAGPACVDVITHGGHVLRTVVDSNMATELCAPLYLCTFKGYVLMSDWKKFAVHKVDVTKGHLVDTLTHEDLIPPRQVCVDEEANIYIAGGSGQCVLLRSTLGQWNHILYAPDHSDQGCDRPWGVCVTKSGLLVVAWRKMHSHSVVIGYDLKG